MSQDLETSGTDWARIDDWIERPDPADPARPTPYFVGREPELEQFGQDLAGVAAGHTAGRILIYQGALGVGTTALMAEIRSRIGSLQPERTGLPRFRWLPVQAEVQELAEPTALYRQIRKALKEATGTDPQPEFDGAGNRIPSDVRSDHLAALLQLLNWPDRIGICLMVDQAQDLAGTDRARVASSVLSTFQQGTHHRPVFLTAFGLSDTSGVLGRIENCGGRFSHRHVWNLGLLSDSEVREFLERAFEDWGFPTGQPPWTWVQKIVEAVEGWPPHLKTVAAVALNEIRQAERADRDPVWPEERIAESKRDYYVGRLTGGLAQWGELYLQLARQTGPFEESDIGDLFDQFVSTKPRLQNLDFEEFLSQSVHRGVLSYDSSGRLDFPIPSFRNYLAERFGAKEPEPGNNQDDDLTEDLSDRPDESDPGQSPN